MMMYGVILAPPQSQPETSPDSDQATLEHRSVHIEFLRFETDFRVALLTFTSVSDVTKVKEIQDCGL